MCDRYRRRRGADIALRRLTVRNRVSSEPITSFDVRDPSRRQFGLLEFRGGLVLRSPSKNFGGISAIRLAADGAHFIAVSDKEWWFRGRLLYEGTRPSGIADAEMAPMLGADGHPLAARGWYDAESIAVDGTLYVGIERVHQIVSVQLRQGGPTRARSAHCAAAGPSLASCE